MAAKPTKKAPMTTGEPASVPALATLEERVRQAASELVRLRETNGTLERRVAELEARLEEAGAAGAASVPPAAAAAWAGEREEIRERVQHLVRTLEELLDEPPESVGVQASLEA